MISYSQCHFQCWSDKSLLLCASSAMSLEKWFSTFLPGGNLFLIICQLRNPPVHGRGFWDHILGQHVKFNKGPLIFSAGSNCDPVWIGSLPLMYTQHSPASLHYRERSAVIGKLSTLKDLIGNPLISQSSPEHSFSPSTLGKPVARTRPGVMKDPIIIRAFQHKWTSTIMIVLSVHLHQYERREKVSDTHKTCTDVTFLDIFWPVPQMLESLQSTEVSWRPLSQSGWAYSEQSSSQFC